VVSGAGRYRLPAGTVARFEGAGGGGFGNPLRRDPEGVARDVRAGYVSVAAARTEYGVELDPGTLEVDVAKTSALRLGVT
jgi:N-methylhydantoinase B